MAVRSGHYYHNILLIISLLSCALESSCQTALREIVVTSVLNDPFLMRSPQGHNQFEGFNVDLAEKLFDKLGLLYRLKIVEDGRYGSKHNVTGNWDGLIGEIMLKQADMALGDLSVTALRAEAVDFSAPFMQSQLAILMKSPKKKGSGTSESAAIQGSNSFFPWLQPMTLWFWIAFIFVSILLLFLIYFVEKTVSRKISKLQPPPDETLFAQFGTRVFGTPKSIATRFLQVTFWIFILISSCAYASNFAADKILDIVHESEAQALPIKYVEQLLEHDEIKCGILKTGSTFNYFQTSQNPLISKMNEKIMANGTLIEKYDRGIQRVQNSNGNFAFIMESPAAKYAILRKPCQLSIVPNFFGPKKGFAVAIAKDSKRLVLGKINSAILQLNDEGVLDNLAEKWFKDQSECDGEAKQKIDIDRIYNPLKLENVASLFIVLTISIFVIFITAGVETVLNRKTVQTV